VHCTLREPKEATACLQRALQLAEVEGMRRIFLDEHTTIAPLLEQLAVSSAYAARLLADLPGALDAQGRHPNNDEQESRMHESLTPRELDILRLVARGASNQQIGDQLVLTVGTVKGHVNHILGKLSARNRTQAAARGRELGII
jgi:LuxR family transcriptional regulator, maltose regulon positive regulatory protein